MYEGRTVGVVIPAYNEERFVGDVIDEVPAFVDRVYVVDDQSTDGTWEAIQRRADRANGRDLPTAIADGGAAAERRVVPIRHETNRGRGGAVKTGYRRALEDDLDVIAVIDGDGQMDPSILDRFVDPIVAGEADYAKGNRLLSPEHREEMSSWRLFGNLLLTYLTKVASGYWRLMDPQNGYTAISADTLDRLDHEGLYEDYGFLNDLLMALNARDARVVDVAMRARYGDEESGIRYTTFIPKLSKLLLGGFLRRLKVKYLVLDFHPLVQLYALGALGALAAVGGLGWAVADGGSSLAAGATVAALFLLSGLLVTLAMIFDRANNAHLEGRIDDPPGGS